MSSVLACIFCSQNRDLKSGFTKRQMLGLGLKMPNAHNESLSSLPSSCICLYCGSDSRSVWFFLMAVVGRLFISVPRRIPLLMKAHFKLAIFPSRDKDTKRRITQLLARFVGHHSPQMPSCQLLRCQTSIASLEGSSHCLCLPEGGVPQPNCFKMSLQS